MSITDWRDKLSFVYSTNPDFSTQDNSVEEVVTPLPAKQNLRVRIDKKNRGGKVVTIVSGFIGSNDDFKELAKMLKNGCGVGGSAKDGDILIQGNFCDRVVNLLIEMGYKAKRSGG
jgi:translation initiation factor 1